MSLCTYFGLGRSVERVCSTLSPCAPAFASALASLACRDAHPLYWWSRYFLLNTCIQFDARLKTFAPSESSLCCLADVARPLPLYRPSRYALPPRGSPSSEDPRRAPRRRGRGRTHEHAVAVALSG